MSAVFLYLAVLLAVSVHAVPAPGRLCPPPTQCAPPNCLPGQVYTTIIDARGCQVGCRCEDVGGPCESLRCLIRCEHGYAKNGCDTCTCLPPPPPITDEPCPVVMCRWCEHGYVKNSRGCDTCTCLPKPPRTCLGHITCMIHCEYGRVKDRRGCDTCQCREPQDLLRA